MRDGEMREFDVYCVHHAAYVVIFYQYHTLKGYVSTALKKTHYCINSDEQKKNLTIV